MDSPRNILQIKRVHYPSQHRLWWQKPRSRFARLIGTSYTILGQACESPRLGIKRDSAPALRLVTPTTVTDIDGNTYNIVIIGTQSWMGENLKVTRYRNGDSIPNVLDHIEWETLSFGAYSSYNNDTSLGNSYGFLYNWKVVQDSRKVCPDGWHVPTDAEWSTLINYLGGESIAGGKLKEKGTSHWRGPNIGATNESLFTALPGGYRSPENREFSSIGGIGYWWSSTDYNLTSAWWRFMSDGSTDVFRGYGPKRAGFSIRCIRD